VRYAEARLADSTHRHVVGKFTLALGCLGLIAVLWALAAPSPAQAVGVHVLEKTFTLSPAANNPNAVAIDEASGSVYVMSQGGTTPTGDIQKYSASGTPENFSALGKSVLDTACAANCRQIAVDNSGGVNQGVIYVSSSATGAAAEIETYLPTGTKVASIKGRSDVTTTNSFCGVAVDKSGAVYAAHPSGTLSLNYIDKFQPLKWETNPAQVPPPTGTVRPLDVTNPCRLAADSKSKLTAMRETGATSAGEIRWVHPPGSGFDPPEPPFQPGTSTLITSSGRHPAIDVLNNSLYVTKEKEVERYSPSGTLLETFGAADGLNQGQGVAVNSTNGKVYVSDRGTVDKVFIYKEINAPLPTADPATNVLRFTATLNGKANPDGAGEVTGCGFEYVTDATWKSTKFQTATKVPCEQPLGYPALQAVTANLAGLTTETTYHYRLAVANANGPNVSGEQLFTTHAVESLVTGSATDVGPREATLHASFTGIGLNTDYYFQYGTSTSYDQVTPTESAGTTNGVTPIELDLSGLELQTTYHYRVAAVNSSGTTFGEDKTFTTLPAVDGVTTLPASSISQDSITLNGRFNGNGEDTSYYFEYGPTTAYGMTSETPPGSDAGSALGLTPVSSKIYLYQGYTTYHFRVVATNSFGKTVGGDQTVTTLPAPVPGVSAGTASNVGAGGATLSAMVNPNRWDTVYLFEWGQTTAYGHSTELQAVIGGLDNLHHPVEAAATGLAPGTLYHFRVVASNFTGTTNGPDSTFVTPDAPGIESSGVGSVGQTTARLEAAVLGNGSPTDVSFEYGTSTAYGQRTASVFAGQSLFRQPVSTEIGGLAPGTTYHARAIAVNGISTTQGPDITFTTQTAPPEVKPPGSKKCKRGFVKRRGKCVKRPKHRKPKRSHG
jgi:hypothetical protein